MKGQKQALRPVAADRHFGGCQDCGRVRYRSKQMAKLAARQLHPGTNLRAIRCGDYWHYAALTAAKKNYRPFQGARATLVIVDEATCLPWEAS
ncbi:hypothetical protein AB0I81_30090 [Nonomuraea sp. NPDC050404]|uniref:hypothetical protein n=1 Tax=Nonomuraea sp. NPDC050404 TaxID=3155783 RepID=UPI0033ECDA5B